MLIEIKITSRHIHLLSTKMEGACQLSMNKKKGNWERGGAEGRENTGVLPSPHIRGGMESVRGFKSKALVTLRQ